MALCIKGFLIFAVNQDSEFALDSDGSQTSGCIQTITIFVNKIQISGFYPRNHNINELLVLWFLVQLGGWGALGDWRKGKKVRSKDAFPLFLSSNLLWLRWLSPSILLCISVPSISSSSHTFRYRRGGWVFYSLGYFTIPYGFPYTHSF